MTAPSADAGTPAGRASAHVEGHCFVVPAYGRSPFLGRCLESLAAQTRASPVIVSTSSPYAGLDELVAHYGASLHVHGPNRGIGADWNEALRVAPGTWVTLAHQDDVYAPSYTASMLEAVYAHPDATLAMSLAAEVGADGSVRGFQVLAVKRLLTELAFLGRGAIRGKLSRRALLAFGNPVVCPSVMLNRAALDGFRFREDLVSNLDWAAWVELAQRCGAFVLVRQALVAQRTHAQAATTRAIRGGARSDEDRMMFSLLWPRPISDLLAVLYRIGYLNRRRLPE